jgi:hypothetical protein
MKQSCWIVCAVAVLIAGFTGLELLAQAQDALIGTWELNVAKSKFNPGPPLKSSVRKFEAVPNGMKYSGQSVRADGTIGFSQYAAYFDGKDYPITGDANADTVSLKRIDRFTTEGTFKKAGKVTYRVRRVVSQDGKVWTHTSEGTNAQGKPFSDYLVFEKK